MFHDDSRRSYWYELFSNIDHVSGALMGVQILSLHCLVSCSSRSR